VIDISGHCALFILQKGRPGADVFDAAPAAWQKIDELEAKAADQGQSVRRTEAAARLAVASVQALSLGGIRHDARE
jgi:cytochrome c556